VRTMYLHTIEFGTFKVRARVKITPATQASNDWQPYPDEIEMLDLTVVTPSGAEILLPHEQAYEVWVLLLTLDSGLEDTIIKEAAEYGEKY